MPRLARIDAPRSLHHLILRGIERRAIFRDEQDCQNFLHRLGAVLAETETPCYAWALMTNHVHLLMRSGLSPIATVMRRVLTGYAQEFNRRHRRHGHLFQNRYKSVLCEEDPYLLDLVRYIHLNPLRAGLVEDLKGLSTYPRTGHAVLLGKFTRTWQDTDFVLGLFGRAVGAARRAYAAFVKAGAEQGRRADLVGGGLLRSVGGWSALKARRSQGMRLMGDERILGSSDFVERVLEQAEEQYERTTRAFLKGPDLDAVLDRVADCVGVDREALQGASKQRDASRARSLACYLAVRRLMLPGVEVARKLTLSPSSVSKAAIRGRADSLAAEIEKSLFPTSP